LAGTSPKGAGKTTARESFFRESFLREIKMYYIKGNQKSKTNFVGLSGLEGGSKFKTHF
jgi:hypothetical protein